jgi:hypothetical protein
MKEPLFQGNLLFFLLTENIGPPHITTLSLPGLTIGLPVWLFSTQVIPNAASASVVSTSPEEHQPHVDPSPSSPSSLARSSSVSYSSSRESSEASNSVNKKSLGKCDTCLGKRVMYLGGFLAHGFCRWFFYFRLRN